jgi:1-acyl-sn-glycerol-3-phosphate acyltransferase
MPEALLRIWRLFATVLGFALFGGGALLLGIIYFPLLHVLVRDDANRVRLARLTMHRSFRAFLTITELLGLIRCRIIGREKLARTGLFILANHPSLLDVVFLIALVPNADCVVKPDLLRNPLMRIPMRTTGYVSHPSGVEVIEGCIASLTAGNNLIMFPEGTRTIPNRAPCLQKGAAYIAVRSSHDITPVTINCRPVALAKGQPWWSVATERIQFVIEVRDDIKIKPFLSVVSDRAGPGARQLTDYLTAYFSAENRPHAGA